MDHELADRKINRISLACETCRKRKRKCDGSSPCVWCYKNQLECVYIKERRRKRRLDSYYTTSLEDENLLLKDYIRQLEHFTGISSRPTYMSQLLTNTGDELEEPAGPPSPDLGPKDHPNISRPTVTAEEAAIDDVSSMVWKMSISDDGISSFVGPSGNFCFPSARSASPMPSTVQSTQPTHSSHSTTAVGDLITLVTPCHETPGSATELLALFSRYINSVHHFLDDDTLAAIASVSQSKPSYALLRNAVLAAAALFSDDLGIREQVSSSYAEAAAADVLRCSRDHPSTVTLQALAILCWREIGLENENEAWLYNGMCVSLCVHLGLHVSSLENLRQTQALGVNSGEMFGMNRSNQIHIQNRAFWASFNTDRMATSIMGRNCMLPTSRVYAIPLIESLGPHPSPGDIVFHYHTRAWLLHDLWMDSIYSFHFNKLPPFKRLQLLLDARDQLQTFLRELPPEASLRQKQINHDVIILHMIHHMSSLLIHRPYLKEAPSTAARSLASKNSIEAASQIVTLIKSFPRAKVSGCSTPILGLEVNSAVTADWSKAPFVVIHCILPAAISLLLNAASSSVDQDMRGQLISRFRVCLAALASMASRWLRARRAVVLLRQLAYRWNTVWTLPIEYSSPLGEEDARLIERSGGTLGRRENRTNETPQKEEGQASSDPWSGWADPVKWTADIYDPTLNPNLAGDLYEWNFHELLGPQQ